jgi:hypothetical protein
MVNELIQYVNEITNAGRWVKFEEEVFSDLTSAEAIKLIESVNPNAMLYLPKKEIDFFEWLKTNDRKIWDDMWEDPDYPPYIVSISFLPLLIYNSNYNGFPICDLMDNDNYYFNAAMMSDDHSNEVLEAAKTRFDNNLKLDLHHLLALEVAFNSIDIWHFAYKYHLDVETAKMSAQILIKDKALKHLKKFEDVAKYIDFNL